jgi:hypothetical protein
MAIPAAKVARRLVVLRVVRMLAAAGQKPEQPTKPRHRAG